MGEKTNNKFTWIIKEFPSLPTDTIRSDEFVIDGCKWHLWACTGVHLDKLWVYLCVGDSESLPCGWRRYAKCGLTVVNQLSDKLSQREVGRHRFYQKSSSVPLALLRPAELHTKDGGFLVNDELKIVAEVEVLEVVGIVNVSEESEEATQPLKKIKLENGVKSNDLLNKTNDSVDVNGFHVLPSQAEYVGRIFVKHPDMALEYRAKSQHLRTACMNVLLNLIGTLCQSLQELTNDDLVEADNALAYVKDGGFKVDWLEKKLEEVKKKKEEQIGETRTRELEEELKDLKRKCSKVEALLEKEKAKVLAARSQLTLDDFV